MEFEKAEKYIYDKMKRELAPELFYHSINHIDDVLNAAMNYAKLEGLNSGEIKLLRIGVLFHDSGFTQSALNHEETGCKIARKALPEFNFKNTEIEIICGMIMSTQIPQNPQTKLEEIICDADLDYLGREDYDPISKNLYKEMTLNKTITETDWFRIQINFLEKHKYFTASAKKLREGGKEATLIRLKQSLNSQ